MSSAIYLAWVIQILAAHGIQDPSHDFQARDTPMSGRCETAEGRNVMVDLLVLKNRRLTQVNDSSLSVIINGESVRFFEDDVNRGRDVRVDWMVSPDSDKDVDLSFAVLDGRAVVYWRETFQHRVYDQGVFEMIEDGVLQDLCVGRGGAERLS